VALFAGARRRRTGSRGRGTKPATVCFALLPTVSLSLSLSWPRRAPRQTPSFLPSPRSHPQPHVSSLAPGAGRRRAQPSPVAPARTRRVRCRGSKNPKIQFGFSTGIYRRTVPRNAELHGFWSRNREFHVVRPRLLFRCSLTDPEEAFGGGLDPIAREASLTGTG
jgi:hypothetical protein